jgi:hypothetical protein
MSKIDYTDYLDCMDGTEVWSLCEEMTVTQTALYLSGHNPSFGADIVESQIDLERPKNYDPIKQIIVGGLRRGEIKGHLVPLYGCDAGGSRSPIDHSIDPDRSIVDMDSVQIFLEARGLKLASRARKSRLPDKLRAGLDAFLATESTPLRGKTRKQVLTDWLKQNAAEYRLVDDRGKPITHSIDEIARVANPDPAGGAPRTPGS